MTSTIINDIDQLAQIKVHWEDTLDNHSITREKEIEVYFKKKYKTDKVKVVFNAIGNKQSGIEYEGNAADASEMILDENYQKVLINKYLEENNVSVNMEYLNKLDGTVNTHLEDYKDNTSRYKKYSIESITFSNFLSFGDNNKLEVSGKPGITAIISDPANYGGKTTATIDLLLFLFFGVTTKTKKNIEIFNRFRAKDEVWVRGEIKVEGDTFILERTLNRKMTSTGDYKVTTTMEFQKKLIRGGYKSLKGDERKVTEELIKTYVGTEDDFLITILSTADNLDDLIKTLPTERGRILTRFIGLEFFREKEKIAKGLYDDWKKTSKLHSNNVADLTTKIAEFKNTIDETNMMKQSTDLGLTSIKTNIESKKAEQDKLLEARVPIDTELYKVNEDEIITAINGLTAKISERKTVYANALKEISKPETEYDVDAFSVLENRLRECEFLKNQHTLEQTRLEATNIQLKNSENCVTCARPLEGVDFTKKIKENVRTISTLVTKLSELSDEISVTSLKIQEMKTTKVLWDDLSKKELTVGKIKLELEQYSASLKRGQDKLNSYQANKENVKGNRVIDTKLEMIKNDLVNMDEEKDMYMLKSRGFEKDIENANVRIDEFNKLIVFIKREEVIDKIYRTYLEIYGKNGISKMVLSTMIPLINTHLKAFLSDSCDFTLAMKMNEKNEVEFWMEDSETGIEKPLAAGSGFEKTVSSLALRCVLTKVCSLPKPNIILFDEVFGKVANDNLEKIGLFFDKIKEHFEQIWIISHNPFITEWADHTIKIRKTNQISELINM